MVEKKTKPIMISSRPVTAKTTVMSFYIYRWGNGFTTFLIASSSKDALNKIAKNREEACPPEVLDEKIIKANLKKANQDFILTVGSTHSDEKLENNLN